MSEDEISALYETSLDVLELPTNSLRLVTSTGIVSVGDCIDFFDRLGDALIQVPNGFLDAMFDEVKPKLQALGYLPPDEA